MARGARSPGCDPPIPFPAAAGRTFAPCGACGAHPGMSTFTTSARQALQRARFQQGANGASAMTVQPLFLRRHLSKGLPRPRDQEDRVVAEAGLASPLRHDLAATLALEHLGRPAQM